MFNLFKPRITSEDMAKKCVYIFAKAIYALEDRSIRDRWEAEPDDSESQALIDEGVLEIFIRQAFRSKEFESHYKKLDEFELELARMGVRRAGVSMRKFIKEMLAIWDQQVWLSKNEPKMRISWKFPKFEDYKSGLYSIQMLFIGHIRG
jgi:hypothetical protein